MSLSGCFVFFFRVANRLVDVSLIVFSGPWVDQNLWAVSPSEEG